VLLSAAGSSSSSGTTPTVTAVSPSSGAAAGGTSVTVSGTNLTGATAVHFGSIAATFSNVTAGSLTATAPAGSGTVNVTVTTPGGTSATSAADDFAYVASTTPTVTSVSPTSGPVAGGNSVTIGGTNLTGATVVKFGSASGTNLTVNGATSLSVTAPAGTGTVDVTVTGPGGTSATSSADHYSYTSSSGPATIASVGSLSFKAGTDTTTLAVTPQHVGDLEVLTIKADANVTVTSISGGGVSSWTKAEGYTGYAGHDLEIWTGAVTSSGAATITAAFSGSVASDYTGMASQEFSASSGTSATWAVDTGGGISNASSSTVTFPKLTPSGTGELYFSYAAVANNASAGTASGFSYSPTSDGDVATYDTSVSAAVQPTATQNPAGASGAIAVLLSAAGSSSSSGTPVTIARAAEFPVNSESTNNASITVDPQKVGDLLVLSEQLHSTTITVTAVSGGNAGMWKLAGRFVDTANTLTYEVWYAVATKTGSAAVNVTYSASTTLPEELIADSYTTSSSATWSVVTSGGSSNGSSATVNWPTLESGPSGAQVYWGASEEHGTGLVGSTPGFIYGQTNEGNEYLSDVLLNPSTAYSPTAGSAPAGVSTAIGVIFAAK
jgi:hypothetical protein